MQNFFSCSYRFYARRPSAADITVIYIYQGFIENQPVVDIVFKFLYYSFKILQKIIDVF